MDAAHVPSNEERATSFGRLLDTIYGMNQKPKKVSCALYDMARRPVKDLQMMDAQMMMTTGVAALKYNRMSLNIGTCAVVNCGRKYV